MTNSPGAVRRGSQRPRIEHFPLFHTTAADDAVDIASVAGLELDPWQEYVLRGALGERRDGRWSAFRTCLVVPRQNGKNAILEARELAGLLLFGESVITHTAHEFKTSYNSMIALMNRIKACELIEYVQGGSGITADTDIRDIDGFKTGNNPSITMTNGNKVQFFARTGGSGRGFTGDLVVLDEAYALKAAEMSALLPTLSAKSVLGNPQVWFTSSAGMPESDLLASLREQGIEGESDRLAYFEWSAEDDADPLDVDAWYQANPALGIRISEEYVRDEFDTLVGRDGDDEGFKRERLGIWARLGGEAVFPTGVWAGLVDEDSSPGADIVFGVDVTPMRDSASIVAVSRRLDGCAHVEIIETREGLSWLPSVLADLQAKWSPQAIVGLAGTGVDALMPSFRSARVRLRLVKFAEYVQSCARFYDAVMEGQVRHLGDEILDEAVDAAKQQWGRDNASWSWSRKTTAVDISSLVAATVAFGRLSARQKRDAGERRKAVIL